MANLKIIKGCVEDLVISKGYEDIAFSKGEKNIAGISAIGAGLIGQSVNSVVLANASSGAEIDMEFFSCTVHGQRLAGGFHKVGFKENDVIEFVVKEESGDLWVLAARSEGHRMLWMAPYETRGTIAQKRSDRKWTLIISAAAVFLFELSETIIFKRYLDSTLGNEIIMAAGIFSMVASVNYFARLRFVKFSVNATKVFEVFGYKNPLEVDLYADHKRAEKKLQIETGELLALVPPWVFRY